MYIYKERVRSPKLTKTTQSRQNFSIDAAQAVYILEVKC